MFAYLALCSFVLLCMSSVSAQLCTVPNSVGVGDCYVRHTEHCAWPGKSYKGAYCEAGAECCVKPQPLVQYAGTVADCNPDEFDPLKVGICFDSLTINCTLSHGTLVARTKCGANTPLSVKCCVVTKPVVPAPDTSGCSLPNVQTPGICYNYTQYPLSCEANRGSSYIGYCEHSSYRCCILPQALVSAPNTDGCSVPEMGEVHGICIDANLVTCPGKNFSGFCEGHSNVKCCFPDEVSYVTTVINRVKRFLKGHDLFKNEDLPDGAIIFFIVLSIVIVILCIVVIAQRAVKKRRTGGNPYKKQIDEGLEKGVKPDDKNAVEMDSDKPTEPKKDESSASSGS